MNKSIKLSEDLLAAYNETKFTFLLDGQTYSIYVGQQSQKMIELLDNKFSALYITAWNPFGRVESPDVNKSQNYELLKQLNEETQHEVLIGAGISEDALWSEDSYLAIGINKERAINLCIEFEQNAVVFIPPAGVPELLINPKFLNTAEH